MRCNLTGFESRPTQLRGCKRALKSVHCQVSTNGASRNGNGAGHYSQHSGQATVTRDMYVADLDLTRDSWDTEAEMSMSVPTSSASNVPKSKVQHLDTVTYSGESLELARNNDALRAELQQVKGDLVDSQQEVQKLQVQLADKDRTLQATKADLIETRMELANTEEKLREVQDRLRTATNERSEYRQYLLEAQAELQQTRAELVEWSEGLVELKSVMEGLDDDLSDLFGKGAYQTALSEVEELTSSITADYKMAHEAVFQSVDEDAESIAAALRDLRELSAEVLRQAEEDARLFDQ